MRSRRPSTACADSPPPNFGDGAVFVERFVERARHVEVQIAGDGLGTVVDLGERDCSVQRRHQKVIEETPAPGISERLRDGSRANARAPRRIGRLPVGRHRRVHRRRRHPRPRRRRRRVFLEVNTRLQVEHGVTELVARRRSRRVDVVPRRRVSGPRHSTRSAVGPAGRSRPGCTPRIRSTTPRPAPGSSPSWCCRPACASTPGSTPGRRSRRSTTRCIGKLLVHAPTRRQAIAALAEALAATRVDGIKTNRDQLSAVAASEWFRDATMTDDVARRVRPVEQRDQGARRRTVHHGAGPSRPPRLLGRRHPPVGADGRPVVPPRQRPPRQRRGRAGAGDHVARADHRVPRRDLDRARRRRLRSTPRRCAGRRCGPSSTSRRGSRLELGGCVGPGMRGVVAVAGGLRRAATSRQCVDVRARRLRRARRPCAAGRRRASRSASRPSAHEDRGVERARRGTAGAHGRLGDRRPRRPARRA